MKRRIFLAASTAASLAPLARPAIGGQTTTIIHVPQGNLVTLDPVFTTAIVTRNAAAMVFETLFGRDEKLEAKPQMLSGYTTEENGLRWTMKLREGLRFHDGTPVRAADCVASLRRWMKRRCHRPDRRQDRLDELTAPDDKTLVWRLEETLRRTAERAGQDHKNTPSIMPERIAATDPFKQISRGDWQRPIPLRS